MYESFSVSARKVMALANQEALRFNHEYIGTEHILCGLVKVPGEVGGVAHKVLVDMGMNLVTLRVAVEKEIKAGPEPVGMGKLPQTPRAKKVAEYAIEEARNLNHNEVGPEHLLLGLIRERDGLAARVLREAGLTLEETRNEILLAVPSSAPDRAADGLVVLSGEVAPVSEKVGELTEEQVLAWLAKCEPNAFMLLWSKACQKRAEAAQPALQR